jgi:hypothetical protein
MTRRLMRSSFPSLLSQDASREHIGILDKKAIPRARDGKESEGDGSGGWG